MSGALAVDPIVQPVAGQVVVEAGDRALDGHLVEQQAERDAHEQGQGQQDDATGRP